MKLLERGTLKLAIHTEEDKQSLLTVSDLSSPSKLIDSALSNLHGRFWLQCNCNESPPAVMTIRKGKYGFCLVKIPGRGGGAL